jgi:hypothetical protein
LRIEHLNAEPTPIYLTPEPAALEGAAGFKVENPDATRFALHAAPTFFAPADGLALLVYARSEPARISASLYRGKVAIGCPCKCSAPMCRC